MGRWRIREGAPGGCQPVRNLIASDAHVRANLLQQGGPVPRTNSSHNGVQEGRMRAVKRGGVARSAGDQVQGRQAVRQDVQVAGARGKLHSPPDGHELTQHDVGLGARDKEAVAA
jgi:hypothetical protein